jgi:hypothetical protein
MQLSILNWNRIFHFLNQIHFFHVEKMIQIYWQKSY